MIASHSGFAIIQCDIVKQEHSFHVAIAILDLTIDVECSTWFVLNYAFVISEIGDVGESLFNVVYCCCICVKAGRAEYFAVIEDARFCASDVEGTDLGCASSLAAHDNTVSRDVCCECESCFRHVDCIVAFNINSLDAVHIVVTIDINIIVFATEHHRQIVAFVCAVINHVCGAVFDGKESCQNVGRL